MDEMTSSEFRRRYATLTKPTRVTVLGRPIGVWEPYTASHAYAEALHNTVASRYEPIMSVIEIGQASPAEVDRVRERFNSRPFTPAPKKGK